MHDLGVVVEDRLEKSLADWHLSLRELDIDASDYVSVSNKAVEKHLVVVLLRVTWRGDEDKCADCEGDVAFLFCNTCCWFDANHSYSSK